MVPEDSSVLGWKKPEIYFSVHDGLTLQAP